jgi:hypothetical protein
MIHSIFLPAAVAEHYLARTLDAPDIDLIRHGEGMVELQSPRPILDIDVSDVKAARPAPDTLAKIAADLDALANSHAYIPAAAELAGRVRAIREQLDGPLGGDYTQDGEGHDLLGEETR